ncbi:MAG: hypothetical protein RL733_1300, partial [Actinomycetota bacterium]
VPQFPRSRCRYSAAVATSRIELTLMLEAIFLGILQGLTEFLPISSSAHIRLAGEFLPSAQDPGATFTAIMQIGTEIAVLLYFRNELARIFSAAFKWLIGTRREASSDESKLSSVRFQYSYLVLLGRYIFATTSVLSI